MKAFFVKKAIDLVELKELAKGAKADSVEGTDYEVERGIEMGSLAFRKFTEDFLKDQPWIESTDGGLNKYGGVRCIKVINRDTKEKVLVNSEGYRYPRCIAIEE